MKINKKLVASLMLISGLALISACSSEEESTDSNLTAAQPDLILAGDAPNSSYDFTSNVFERLAQDQGKTIPELQSEQFNGLAKDVDRETCFEPLRFVLETFNPDGEKPSQQAQARALNNTFFQVWITDSPDAEKTTSDIEVASKNLNNFCKSMPATVEMPDGNGETVPIDVLRTYAITKLSAYKGIDRYNLRQIDLAEQNGQQVPIVDFNYFFTFYRGLAVVSLSQAAPVDSEIGLELQLDKLTDAKSDSSVGKGDEEDEVAPSSEETSAEPTQASAEKQ